MLKGIVVKATGGYYYIWAEGQIWECKLRGRFRQENIQVVVGDDVVVRSLQNNTGVIEQLLPRRSLLRRPLIANVGQVLAVLSIRDPKLNLTLLDRLLLLIELSNIKPLICFNKVDLEQQLPGCIDTYRVIGYQVFITSAITGAGLDDLKKALSQYVSVLAGPSGVGKSTLLNALQPGLALKTKEISVKLKSGRHTTRQVELFFLEHGGLVADTPGFLALDLPEIRKEELADFFPELASYQNKCRFTGCLHLFEPDCAVKAALEKGLIAPWRYQHYLKFLREIMEQKRRY